VHLGPGPGVDDVHARSLRAALVTGETLQITDPGESPKTASVHVTAILRKLGVASRVQAAAVAEHAGLLIADQP